MDITTGWVAFKEKYSIQAAKLETIYRHFTSFPGNCIFYVNSTHITAKDITGQDNPWVWIHANGYWTIE